MHQGRKKEKMRIKWNELKEKDERKKKEKRRFDSIAILA